MAKSSKFMTFLPGNHDVPLSQNDENTGISILELALKNKLDIDSTCGGMGTCGTCMVVVEAGLELMSERNEIETEFAQERGLKPNERLSCQNVACAGLVLKVSHKKRLYKSK